MKKYIIAWVGAVAVHFYLIFFLKKDQLKNVALEDLFVKERSQVTLKFWNWMTEMIMLLNIEGQKSEKSWFME